MRRSIGLTLTVVRLLATCLGYFVFLMWVAGIIGLADFALLFTVRPGVESAPPSCRQNLVT